MTMLLDEPTADTETSDDTEAALRLRSACAALRLSFTWFGTRRTLSAQQKAQAAESFGAEGEFLSAGKKLIDVRHPAYRAVTAVRTRAVSYFKGVSLPFPEPGVRLVRQDDVEGIDDRLTTLRDELDEAVGLLEERYDELRSAARTRLGRLYNAGDYPPSLVGLFAMGWDFPSVEPPAYLARLSPDLYRQECRRVQARFDEAVRLAESAFAEELARLVEHLAERLTGRQDGKPKVLRESAVDNFTDFFDRFGRLHVGSSEQLEELVEEAQRIVQGIAPCQLREDRSLRERVAAELSVVQGALGDLLIDRPRRNILRPTR